MYNFSVWCSTQQKNVLRDSWYCWALSKMWLWSLSAICGGLPIFIWQVNECYRTIMYVVHVCLEDAQVTCGGLPNEILELFLLSLIAFICFTIGVYSDFDWLCICLFFHYVDMFIHGIWKQFFCECKLFISVTAH